MALSVMNRLLDLTQRALEKVPSYHPVGLCMLSDDMQQEEPILGTLWPLYVHICHSRGSFCGQLWDDFSTLTQI